MYTMRRNTNNVNDISNRIVAIYRGFLNLDK